MSSEAQELVSALRKLRQFSYVRDRDTEREPRYITLTDDEGAAILTALRLTGQDVPLT